MKRPVHAVLMPSAEKALTLAAAALIAAAGCDRGTPPVPEMEMGAALPATLMFVEGFDDEGGLINREPLSDTMLVAYFLDDVLYADARVVVQYLAPEMGVDAMDGTLRVDGSDTDIPVTFRDSVAFVPLRQIASRFGAYARVEESPGRMATVWRSDMLCRYARAADRRASVFLEAGEQGLLRQCDPPIEVQIRRWTDALPTEVWAASFTLRQPLDSAGAAALLKPYGAAPYAAYGGAAGHHLIVRVAPDSASMHVLGLLDAAAIDALERAVCGLPAALDRRGRLSDRTRDDVDAFHGERHMLASVLAAGRELPRVSAGAPILYGADIVANVTQLRRLAADVRIRRFDPATRLDDGWVLPGADMSAVPGLTVASDIAALDSAALFTRLAAEAARAGQACPAAARSGSGRPFFQPVD